jgi:ABC-type anion transport system duplicated permease subunit
VAGRWWRIFGIAVVISLLLAGQIVADAIALSFAALAGTLLYFDARARSSHSLPAPDR